MKGFTGKALRLSKIHQDTQGNIGALLWMASISVGLALKLDRVQIIEYLVITGAEPADIGTHSQQG